jgi:hypothetical protein
VGVSKEQILAEIRRTAAENNGRPLGRGRFLAETGIREADWLGRYWARWGDAVQEAGFEPNTLQSRFDDNEALRLLAVETRRLGHLPTSAELRLRRRENASFPSDGVFERIGRRAVLAAKLLAFCRHQEDFADVATIVAPLVSGSSPENDLQSDEAADGDEDGFVYLLKMGRHFKLGRTNSLGRRGYELAIQLPERAVQVHAIRTDDPAGIEHYWHERFAAKRRNGEWFSLSAADVRAFRRRKFM